MGENLENIFYIKRKRLHIGNICRIEGRSVVRRKEEGGRGIK